MQNQMQVFQNEEFGEIEVIVIDGKPHFPATECAAILGYAKPENAVARHCKGSLKRGVLTKGGKQEKTFISEGDLYRLIIRSKLPAAIRFEAFVCDEILPSVREHGAYICPELLEKMRESLEIAEDLFECLTIEYAQNSALMNYTDKLLPKAIYHDIVLQSPKAIPISIIAKDYGMSAFAFNRLLHELGVQYRLASTWLLYKEHCNKGYTVSKTYQMGGEVTIHTQWTQQGRRFIYDLLCWHGIYPNAETIAEMAA